MYVILWNFQPNIKPWEKTWWMYVRLTKSVSVLTEADMFTDSVSIKSQSQIFGKQTYPWN